MEDQRHALLRRINEALERNRIAIEENEKMVRHMRRNKVLFVIILGIVLLATVLY